MRCASGTSENILQNSFRLLNYSRRSRVCTDGCAQVNLVRKWNFNIKMPHNKWKLNHRSCGSTAHSDSAKHPPQNTKWFYFVVDFVLISVRPTTTIAAATAVAATAVAVTTAATNIHLHTRQMASNVSMTRSRSLSLWYSSFCAPHKPNVEGFWR